jgi:glycosyltransferase involved in cell wall biosynthesis
MRVVMLTDDVAIDRRILQEAATLERLGHQVIVLAGHDAGRPSHEMLGATRVERLIPVYDGRRERLVIRASGMVGNLVNRGSALSQRLVGAGFGWLFGLGRRMNQAARDLAAGVVESGERRNTKGFRRFGPRVRRTVDVVHGRSGHVIDRGQGIVAGAGVRLTWRIWWVAGVANHRGGVLATKVVRRTRRLPVRDEQLATRTAYFRPDVVHAHDLPQLRGGHVAARNLGVPLVYDAHELYPEIGTLTARQRSRLGRLERRLMPTANASITVNPYIADEMARRYRMAKPHVILNAIDPPSADVEVEQAGNSFRAKLGLGADVRILLFQGWMSETRGLDRLITAVSQTSDHIHLVLLGYGSIIEDLRRHAVSLDVDQRVHFVDAVPQDELLSWTTSADAGVIPYPAVDLNHHFCSPNKLFEFIQAGLPIVANDLPFLRDVVVGEDIGVVAPIEDASAFGRAIESLLGEDTVLLHQCRRRLVSVAPRYTWAVQSDELVRIYESLEHRPPSRRYHAGRRR